MDKLWAVYYEYLEENWQYYDGTTLSNFSIIMQLPYSIKHHVFKIHKVFAWPTWAWKALSFHQRDQSIWYLSAHGVRWGTIGTDHTYCNEYCAVSCTLVLTHWGWDKMAVISRPTFANAFSWMKMNGFRLIFYWILFLRVKSTIFRHWLR